MTDYSHKAGLWHALKSTDFHIGAPKIDMDSEENRGKYLIMDMGAKGAAEFKEKYKNSMCVYVIPPTLERLMSQMEGRGKTRVQRNLNQIEQAKRVCDWLVINDDVDTAASQIETIMHALREHGDDLDSIDLDTMRFLYSKSLHNKENVRFLDEFFPRDLSQEKEI